MAPPLIWWRPKTPLAWKTGWIVAVLALDRVMIDVTLKSLETIKEYYLLMDEL